MKDRYRLCRCSTSGQEAPSRTLTTMLSTDATGGSPATTGPNSGCATAGEHAPISITAANMIATSPTAVHHSCFVSIQSPSG